VERLWGTLQHRLVVDMRLAGVSTIEEANAFLATYPNIHNARFAVEPEREEAAFLPAPSPMTCRTSSAKGRSARS
jgi:hypothetical protein